MQEIPQSEQWKQWNETIKEESEFLEPLLQEMGRVIVGQRPLLERLLVGLLTGGHVLLEGVPGLAKTLTVKTLASALSFSFQRIQFTPDLLPADLIGTMIYQQQTGKFVVKKGPVFANLVLADEINRAPAKVQSALLEAMQERQVTLGDQTFPLPSPFLVLATQNPIEQEGTYPLPEAQVDRFMLMLRVSYPSREEEREIMERMTQPSLPEARPVLDGEGLLRARQLIHQIYIDPKIKEYLLDLIFATREPESLPVGEGERPLSEYIEYGASPRASIFLNLAARAQAFLQRRGYVIPEDVKLIATDVLRHRILLSYEADADEVTSDDVLQRIFDRLPVP